MVVDRNIRILVVDDHASMRQVLRKALDQIGFANIEEAADGSEALTKLGAGRIDFIVSDWDMEPMTGIDLVRAVRASPDLAALPFLMVTAEDTPASMAEAKAAGVSGYLVKPFSAEALKSRMAEILGPI